MPYQVYLLDNEDVLFAVPPSQRDRVLSELLNVARQELPEVGPIRVENWVVSYELDAARQVLTVVAIQPAAD